MTTQTDIRTVRNFLSTAGGGNPGGDVRRAAELATAAIHRLCVSTIQREYRIMDFEREKLRQTGRGLAALMEGTRHIGRGCMED